MSSPQPVVYVFYGQDEPTLRDKLSEFCRQYSTDLSTDMNVARFDGRSARLAEIANAASTLPFLADVRLVLVEDITDSADAKETIDEIGLLIKRLPDWARLVFVETGLQATGQDSEAATRRKTGRRQLVTKLVKLVEDDPRGRALSFDAPKNVARWIVQRAGEMSIAIEHDAASLLAERIGDDLILANTEIEKLATYAGWQRAISREDVVLLTPYLPEANIFSLVDALGQRNGRTALDLLKKLLDEGDEPLRIFGMIVRQYRLLLQMREQIEMGASVSQAAHVLGLKDYPAKLIHTQAQRYSLDLLERVYRLLLETDLAIKTGIQEPSLALDVLIARLARSKATF